MGTELSIIRKHQKLLELKKKLREMEAKEALDGFPVVRTDPDMASPKVAAVLPKGHRRFDHLEVEEFLTTFDGEDPTDDVRKFLERFNDVLDIISADESQRLLYLKAQLRGAAAVLKHGFINLRRTKKTFNR